MGLSYYTGAACERSVCPNDCSGNGVGTMIRASYTKNWDALKQQGCWCDYGFRGADCSLIECPSNSDPIVSDPWGTATKYGGRLEGYTGEACQRQTILM